MQIIDTTTFFEENMMMDLRFNILDPHIDKFIVCESLYTHSGKKKNVNFNIHDFPSFKDKIIHLVIEKEPKDLIIKSNLNLQEKRLNSIYRIRDQRNFIKSALNQFSPEDYVIYSDNDEIPNLENVNFKSKKKKFIIFNQKLFYYKLNLTLPDINWFGSKACKLKNLESVDFLRNIKNRKYSFLRFDTLLSNTKQISVDVINNGGWHFSNLKNYNDLENKYLNDENHAEFEIQKNSKEKIKDNIERQVVPYDHTVKKNSKNRFNETKLIKTNTVDLPYYVKKNIYKFKEWIVE